MILEYHTLNIRLITRGKKRSIKIIFVVSVLVLRKIRVYVHNYKEQTIASEIVKFASKKN